MFSNCGKSVCQFIHKCLNLNEHNRRVGSYNITTRSVINSGDLRQYLFADECSSPNYINTKHACPYEPPIQLGSCDSFQSINSEDDTDSGSDIDSDNEPERIQFENIKIKSQITKGGPFIQSSNIDFL
jgi:hypothetical protein